MKILTLHVDYINFKPIKKALKGIEELSEEQKKQINVKDCLVILAAVEKGDGNESVKELVKNVKEIANMVNAKTIVLYPYAHLSNNLASAEKAIEVLNNSEEELKKTFKVVKAPFGYYKEFEIKVKGHPLSELSRDISFGAEKEKIKIERTKKESAEVEVDHKNLLRTIGKNILDRSKLKSYDHRILGQEMDLFSFNDSVAPGMIFWHNNGLTIRNELINFWREIHKKIGYEEVLTPQMMDSKLWKVSGHWDKYKGNNFISEYEKRLFLPKPMNCPGGMLVYKSKPRSYKDFPIRMAEMGVVHRVELSGVLAGLFRTIQFTQDDAHIFCVNENQTKKEIKLVVSLINLFYKKFNLEFDHVELSTRPKKRIGSDDAWDRAEKLLESVLKELKIKYKINKGEGAFYGPKIDFHVKDSLGRSWQLSTVQLDFSMPERFNLEYTDNDGKRKMPIMLHRVIYGSLERFIGVLLEHTKGRLPIWLSPIQVRVLSFTDRNEKYVREIILKLEKLIPGLRIDSDFRTIPIQIKVKDAELMRVPYIIVAGDKEEKNKNLAVRVKGDKKIKAMKLKDFAKTVKEEIEERKY